MNFTTCPNCKMKVLPKSDGTCPSCQSVIQQKEKSSISKSIEPIKNSKPSAHLKQEPSSMTQTKIATRVVDRRTVSRGSTPKRGFWLTAMLIVWLISNLAIGLYYLVVALTASQSTSLLGFFWLILRTIGNVVFIIALWKWKKWGAYGILASIFLGVLIVMFAGGNPGSLIGSLIGLVIVAGILYLLLRRVWNQMD